jgi:Tol biopolymer transport system component
MHHVNEERGTKVKPTDRTANITSTPKAGLFATLCGLLRVTGSGAPSRRPIATVLLPASLLVLALIPSVASATLTHPPLSFSPITGSGSDVTIGNPVGIAADEGNGNVFLSDGGEVVDILGAEGGAPADLVAPFQLTGFPSTFESATLAVDNSTSSPSKGALYIGGEAGKIQKLTRNSITEQYETVGELTPAAPEFSGGGDEGATVDTHGDLFVTNVYPLQSVFEFNPAGVQTAQIDVSAIGFPTGVAVDSAGDLFVWRGSAGEVYKYPANSAGEIEPSVYTPVATSNEATGIAVDTTTNTLYVALGDHVNQYDATTLEKQLEFGAHTLANTGELTVNSATGRIYVDEHGAGSGKVAVFGPVALVPTVAGSAASSIAATTATLNAAVNPEGIAITECEFEYGPTTAYGSTKPCEGAIPTDSSNHPVTAAVTGLAPNGATYHFRVVAQNANGVEMSADRTFVTGSTVATTAATAVTATAVTLNGVIEPEGTAFTECKFEYGATAAYGFTAPCSPAADAIEPDFQPHEVSADLTGVTSNATYHFRLVATNTSGTAYGEDRTFATLGPPQITNEVTPQVEQTSATLQAKINPSGFATSYHLEWGTTTSYGHRIPAEFEVFVGSGTSPIKITASVTGLQPGVIYHFRVVASNSFGSTAGSDQEFSTLNAAELPNDRAYELVSPANKGPAGRVESFFGEQILYRASDSGDSVSYSLLNGLPDATAGGNLLYLGNRSASGWQSEQQSPPALAPSSNGSGKIYFSSPELTCDIVASTMPLTADTSEESVKQEYEHLYRRNPDGSYTLLTPDPLSEKSFSAFHFDVDGATADCGYVLFESPVALLPGDPEGLYEWDHGTLRFAGVLPDGSLASDAKAGGAENQANAISPDGSRAFFSTTEPGGPAKIFVRENGTRTVEASESQTATPDTGEATYQLVSEDGSDVFFTGMYGLASPSSSASGSTCCDLYDYNADTGVFTDRSVDENAADTEGSGVIGALDASADGSYVYFAAQGQLVPEKGNTYAQNLAGFANVYLNHNGALSYVGVIQNNGSGGDTSNTGNDLASRFGEWVSDTTPDGRYLLFASHANVTGFDNGGQAALYLYSAESNETVCVSCRSNGQPSLAGFDEDLIRVADVESLAGKPQRPRALSKDGRRVVFSSPDVLAPRAVKGGDNVYEWEGGHVFLLLAGEEGENPMFPQYVEMSPSGDDIFVKTKAHLVGEDYDTVADLYDVRAPHVAGEQVGEPAVPPSPVPCEPSEGECQGVATPQPGVGPAPSSERFSGAGDLAPPAVTVAPVVSRPKAKALTRSQQRAEALKACREKPKKKRAVCEAQARRRYAAKPEPKSKAKKRGAK